MNTDKCGVCNIEYQSVTAFCSKECMKFRNAKRITLTDIAAVSEEYPTTLQVVEMQIRDRQGRIRWSKKVYSDGKAIRLPRKCRKKSHEECNHPQIKKWIIEREEFQ